MNYLEFNFICKPSNDWQQDLFINELANIGFDTFESTETGFKAYTAEANFNPVELETLLLGLEGDFDVHYEMATIGHQNWNELWESNFQPIVIRDQVYVRATFHEKAANFPYEIVIDPKMAFGTGHHQTTSLMMECLLEEDVKDKFVLDMGCGTGILSILAAKLLAREVVSIDNDPVCVESANENLQLNNVLNMSVLEGSSETIPMQSFDIILANINRNVLLEQLEYYADRIAKGGSLFLSGFYKGEDLEMLKMAASKQGFSFLGHKEKEDWVAAKFIFEKEND
ncbi:50S ribosomal protein L11 methyltransferase [Albibacterium indicum]|uniref:50S ribosomal protein L11 methyltransferase n=1 Tax=Albibacterium indicum TaxID=2292082 RepID=UPI000E5200CE|nr:50S ribosomal protein L11 methyltransferase [Pedobacter indicus]